MSVVKNCGMDLLLQQRSVVYLEMVDIIGAQCLNNFFSHFELIY